MRTRNASRLAWLQLLAVVFVAICLVPAGAHLFELPAKIGLAPEQYMTVQGIYAGWARFGIAIFGALVLTGWHTLAVRGDRRAFALSLVAFLGIIATQVIFWVFTYPMNAASQNWTVMPPDFEAARRQWEYSHAVNAVITFGAFLAIVLSVVLSERASPATSAAE